MKKQVSCILFALVTSIAACGGDKSETKDTRTNNVPPTAETTATKTEPGFGSGAPVVEKPAVVDVEKPKAELPKVVDTFIPAKASECIALGKEASAKGEHKRARELFLAAIKLDKKSATPHVELARSYIATNDKGLALKHANKAVKLAPKSSQAQNTLGRAELLRHDYDSAILAFREATTLDSDNVWAWNNLGLAYMTQKNYQEAVTALVAATGKKGVEGYMWNNLGLAYEQLDQLDDARDAFDNGAKLGSVAAKASRKRLEGVDTIAIAKPKAEKKPEGTMKKDDGFEAREPMPDVPVEEPKPEPQPEDVIDSLEIEHGDAAVEQVGDPEVPAPLTTL